MESSVLPTLRPKQPSRLAVQVPANVVPISVIWDNSAAPAKIQFSDGHSSLGSCIRCENPPCMEFSRNELELTVFKDFPADKNDSVCPTGAIVWPQDSDTPVVNQDTCISCGLCVSRCPTRAIYLDSKGAQVNGIPNVHFQIQGFPATKEETEATAKLFENIDEKGVYCVESDAVLSGFLAQFEEVAKEQGAQFPNLLARNLLIASGIGTAIRRRGDTNIRMDMVLGPPGVGSGTGEVELGAGVLDAPRNILDNVAVLVARYEVSKNKIVPLIVSLSLPNQRSEYWQVIKDIRTVLGVKINSITVGALVLLVWNRKRIVIESGDELYIDSDNVSLRSKIERILDRVIRATKGYPGLFESEK